MKLIAQIDSDCGGFSTTCHADTIEQLIEKIKFWHTIEDEDVEMYKRIGQYENYSQNGWYLGSDKGKEFLDGIGTESTRSSGDANL